MSETPTPPEADPTALPDDDEQSERLPTPGEQPQTDGEEDDQQQAPQEPAE